jgi:hypothetical protein
MSPFTDTLERRDTFEERIAREVDRLADAQRRAEADLASEFEKAIEAGDPLATPRWARTKEGVQLSAGDVLSHSLDYDVGPGMGDVLRLLSLAMRSTDPMVASETRKLVKRAARCWTDDNVGEVMG